MPTMDFLLASDDGQWKVLTVMLYPTTSPHDVEEWSSFLFSKYAVLSGLFGGERQWQDWAKILSSIDADGFRDGVLAGEQLYQMVRMDQSEMKASAAKAEFLLNEPPLRTELINKLGRKATSHAYVRAAWGKYKSVAHLWAGRKFCDEDDSTLGDTRRLLAVAEYFRQFGVSYSPTANPMNTVLDQESTWRLPDGFQLEKATVKLPGLSAADKRSINMDLKHRRIVRQPRG